MIQSLLLLLLLLTSGAAALAPAQFDDYENVYAYRKRLNITDYGYTPKYLSAEHCKYLDAETCRHDDEAHMQALPTLKRNKRRLNPSIGDFKVMVLLCQFPDHTDRDLPSREDFDVLFNGIDDDEIVNPVGSIREYLYYASMGKFKVTFDVYDWVITDETEAYYAKGTGGRGGTVTMQEMFIPLLNKLDAEFGNDILKWAQYDTTNNQDFIYNEFFGITDDKSEGPKGGDGMLDHLVVIHSGYAAEQGDKDCDATHLNRIWSQGSGATGSGTWASRNGNLQVGGYTLASAFQFLCQTTPMADMAVITHEFLHGFFLADLYDQDYESSPRIQIGGAGNYDIMANAYGWNYNTKIPGSLGAYSRMLAGWLEPIEIVKDGEYSIQASALSAQIYIISDPYPDGEYLLIENRIPIKWDMDWPAGGLVITHVDENAPGQTQRRYPGVDGWPLEHFQVAIQQADGLYDLERGNNMGDAGDLWTNGQVLGPGPDFPNTDAYSGGQVVRTGLVITVTSDPGLITTFKVEGMSGNGANGGNAPFVQDLAAAASFGDVPATSSQEQNGNSRTSEFKGDQGPGESLHWMFSVMGGLALVVGLAVVIL